MYTRDSSTNCASIPHDMLLCSDDENPLCVQSTRRKFNARNLTRCISNKNHLPDLLRHRLTNVLPNKSKHARLPDSLAGDWKRDSGFCCIYSDDDDDEDDDDDDDDNDDNDDDHDDDDDDGDGDGDDDDGDDDDGDGDDDNGDDDDDGDDGNENINENDYNESINNIPHSRQGKMSKHWEKAKRRALRVIRERFAREDTRCLLKDTDEAIDFQYLRTASLRNKPQMRPKSEIFHRSYSHSDVVSKLFAKDDEFAKMETTCLERGMSGVNNQLAILLQKKI